MLGARRRRPRRSRRAASRSARSARSLLELRPFAPDGAEALRLFVDRARAANPAFRLDPDARAAATTICSRLDGLPLALELAAARVRALPVAEIAARLDDRFALLGDARDGGRSHRTLGEIVEWSFGLLTRGRAGALLPPGAVPRAVHARRRRAGRRRRPVDRARAADLLASLVDRSMVSVEDGRYRAARDAARVRPRAPGRARTGWSAAARATPRWARRRSRDVQARRLYAEGADARARRRSRRTAPTSTRRSTSRSTSATATARCRWPRRSASLDFGLGDSARGRTRLARALRLEARARRRACPRSSSSRALLDPARARRARAARRPTEALGWRRATTAGATGRSPSAGCARLLGGDVAGALADFEGLEERLDAARRDVAARRSSAAGRASSSSCSASSRRRARLSTRAMQAFERCDDVWGVLTAAVNLARVDRALGDYDEAARVLERALAVGEARVPDRLGPLLYDFGLVELRREQFEHATELWQRCIELGGPAVGDRRLGAAHRPGRALVRASWPPATSRAWTATDPRARRAVRRGARAARGGRARGPRHDRRQRGDRDLAARPGRGRPTRRRPGRCCARRSAARCGRATGGCVAQVLDALARLVDEPGAAAPSCSARPRRSRDGAGGPLPPVDARAVEAIALSLRALVGDEAFDAALDRGRADPMAVALAVVSRP